MPLHTALYAGRLGVFKTLLAGPGGEVAVNTKDTRGATPLHIACREKGTAGPVAAMTLLEEGCPVKVDVSVRDDDGRTPLYDAVHHGHAEVVKVCEEGGVGDKNAGEKICASIVSGSRRQKVGKGHHQ